MKSFRLRGPQQPLVLALLPLDPTALLLDVREPAVDRRAELGLAAQSRREGDVADPQPEAAAQLGEGAELVELAQPVEAVAGRGARRDDEARLLEVAEHACRPAGAPRGVPHVERVHRRNLNTDVSRLAAGDQALGLVDEEDAVPL